MEFERVKLATVREKNEEDSIMFKGIRLCQTRERPEEFETYQKTVRIYRTAGGSLPRIRNL